jgi:hypothetical protein
VPLGDPSSHSSLGLSGTTGHDVLSSVVFDPPPGGTEAADVGTLVSFDLQTGTRKVVIGFATGYPYPPSGTHVSAVAHRRPGWVAVSAVGDPVGRGILEQELLLANVDTGTGCRVGHRDLAGGACRGYWAEPHVVISPSGTRLLFGSDWGNGTTVDTYVVELPAYSGSYAGISENRWILGSTLPRVAASKRGGDRQRERRHLRLRHAEAHQTSPLLIGSQRTDYQNLEGFYDEPARSLVLTGKDPRIGRIPRPKLRPAYGSRAAAGM